MDSGSQPFSTQACIAQQKKKKTRVPLVQNFQNNDPRTTMVVEILELVHGNFFGDPKHVKICNNFCQRWSTEQFCGSREKHLGNTTLLNCEMAFYDIFIRNLSVNLRLMKIWRIFEISDVYP